MNNSQITVIYKWTAKPGKLAELTAIYEKVTAAMNANEPGALSVHVHVSAKDNAIHVHDVFADPQALGFHLSQTAAQHFPALLEVAVPGAFIFLGDVPEELQAGALNMGLAAEFSPHSHGFNRAA